MWHTSRGDRTLRGGEAALIRNAIDSMVDALMIHVDEEIDDPAADCETGIALFDRFTPTQRIALLHDVAKYLLTDTATAMPLSAAVEATVAAIFADVRDHVAIEIEFPAAAEHNGQGDGESSWRTRVLLAYNASMRVADGDHNGQLPDESCADIHNWEELIDALTDAILWDRDYEMADSFLDVDPGVSHQRRRLLGISEDYFTSIAPDPKPDEVERLISETLDIVRLKPR